MSYVFDTGKSIGYGTEGSIKVWYAEQYPAICDYVASSGGCGAGTKGQCDCSCYNAVWYENLGIFTAEGS